MSAAKQVFPLVDFGNLRRVAIICHRHADPDAYLSAYALSKLFQGITAASVDIITPEGMSTLTKQLHETFDLPVLEESETEYDLFVAVDIGHTELLKNWLGKITGSPGKKLLIDHHPIQKDSIYDQAMVDTTVSSTAELIFRLFKQLGVKTGPETAQAILVGILSDSQHLALASGETLRACVELLDEGADLAQAKRLLRSPPDYGEVVAKLKGAKRSQIFKLNNWIVALSRVGSFQSHVARGLVQLGADVAIVAGEFADETRASLRANQRFHEATDIHLGIQVAEVLSEGKGYGGGHATAASFTSSEGEDRVLKESLSLVAKLLGAEPAEVK